MNSGMYVFGGGQATYYVDPDGGSDTNAGNSPDSPMQTIPAAVAKTKIGDWVLLRRGTRFFTHLDIQAVYRHFGAYGQGVKPIIDGSTLVAGPWTQHGTYSNVWYADVSLTSPTTGDYSFNRAGAWHPIVWDEGTTDTNETAAVARRLRNDSGVDAAATQDQILAIVNAEPHTFCVFKQGSSDPEPRNGNQTGTDWRVYLHTRDGSDPNENGRMVRIAEDRTVLRAGSGQRWHDITFQRSGGGNLVSSATNVTRTEIFKNCDFVEVGFHACVVGGVTFEGCVALATRSHHDAQSQSAGGFHQYRDDVSGTSAGFQIRNCYARGFGFAVYTHGGPSIQHEYYDVDGFIAENCGVVFGGSSRRGVTARNITAKNCGTLCDDGPILIDDASLQLSDAIRRFYGTTISRTLLRNCFVYGSQFLLFLNQDMGSSRPLLELENCTVYTDRGYGDGETSIRRKFSISLKNSIVSGFQGVTGTVTKDASSTYRTIGTWPSDIQHQGHLHTVEMEITEGDVVWINAVNNRTVSYSGTDNGDGTASLSVNFNNRTFGTWIKVPNGNGPGEDYQGRIVSNGASTSDPLTVSPPPQAAFTNVVFQVPVFNHYLHRDTIVGTLSEDGSQIRVPDGRFFYPGNAIRVGSVGTKTFGLRYIASVNGNIVELDKACPWKVSGDNILYNSLDGTTTTNRRSLPTVELSFGFPIHKRQRAESDTPRITVTSSEGVVLWQRQQNNNQTGEFANWSSNAVPSLGTRYLPDGTDRPRAQYNGGIQHELGYWDLGLAGMGIGDTVKFEFKVDIEEEKVRFDIDPAYLRRYLPSKDSRPFQRQAGYRG